ncbi:hypothetical protein NDU88_002880 [Pleurodeles waltl]|uniref:Uncharacterized protein n=1 Tax=Pleurodeles waltl TaxID=8319 RepID=A0AAV7MQX5_PLEWA|nr:hypothetical protein NDU88_002880 [Pleurodeles waltl]
MHAPSRAPPEILFAASGDAGGGQERPPGVQGIQRRSFEDATRGDRLLVDRGTRAASARRVPRLSHSERQRKAGLECSEWRGQLEGADTAKPAPSPGLVFPLFRPLPPFCPDAARSSWRSRTAE